MVEFSYGIARPIGIILLSGFFSCFAFMMAATEPIPAPVRLFLIAAGFLFGSGIIIGIRRLTTRIRFYEDRILFTSILSRTVCLNRPTAKLRKADISFGSPTKYFAADADNEFAVDSYLCDWSYFEEQFQALEYRGQ